MRNNLTEIIYGKSENTLVQFARYAVVGGIAAVFDISVYYLMNAIFGYHYFFSNIAAFCIGLTVNYILSSVWVFGSKQKEAARVARDLMYFTLIGLIGLGISSLILKLFIDILGFESLISKLAATIVTLLWNFTARKTFVFTERMLNK